MIQVYTGNGKGKTTAAIGLCLRARGHGKKVAFVQFMKGMETGEREPLEKLNVITKVFGRDVLLTKENVVEKDYEEAKKALLEANKLLKENDLVVLDEVNVAMAFGLIKEEKVLALLDEVGNKEIVLTGRYAPEKIIKRADLVSEMKEVKHPYQEGTKAREGVEF